MHMNALRGNFVRRPAAQQRCENMNLTALLNQRRCEIQHVFAHSADDMRRELPRQHQDAHSRSPQAEFRTALTSDYSIPACARQTKFLLTKACALWILFLVSRLTLFAYAAG